MLYIFYYSICYKHLLIRKNCPIFVSQVRKYRTMTELIVDAMEFVKNPYKGKKLKVRTGAVPGPGPPNKTRSSCGHVFCDCHGVSPGGG